MDRVTGLPSHGETNRTWISRCGACCTKHRSLGEKVAQLAVPASQALSRSLCGVLFIPSIHHVSSTCLTSSMGFASAHTSNLPELSEAETNCSTSPDSLYRLLTNAAQQHNVRRTVVPLAGHYHNQPHAPKFPWPLRGILLANPCFSAVPFSLLPSWVIAWRKTPHKLSSESTGNSIAEHNNYHPKFVSYTKFNSSGGKYWWLHHLIHGASC